jgi:phosphoglycolate phosphatase
MNAFDVVIFDFDGTLFATRSAIVHCLRRAFAAHDRSMPAEREVAATVNSGLPLQQTLVDLDATLCSDRVALNALIMTYRAIYRDEAAPLLQPFPGVAAVLQRLNTRGTTCVVVSNKGIAAIRRSLDENHLSPFVDLVFGDAPGLPTKPDPAILVDHVMPHYGRLPKERILSVGDTEIDIMFARGAGIASCWAAYGYGKAERCRKLRPEHEISGIEELPAIVHGR